MYAKEGPIIAMVIIITTMDWLILIEINLKYLLHSH